MSTSYTVTIDTAQKDAGITAARMDYNANPPSDTNGNPLPQLATNAAYVQFVMDRAAQSYVNQYSVPA